MDIVERSFLASFDMVAKVNIQTENVIFLKNNNLDLSPTAEFSWENFRAAYRNNKRIHPDDEYLFERYLSSAPIQRMVDAGYDGLLFSYRTLAGESYYWTSVNLFVPHDDSVTDILICERKIRQSNSDIIEALERYNRKIYKIMKCNLTTGDFHVIRQWGFEDDLSLVSPQSIRGLSAEWYSESKLIHTDDLDRFRHFTSHPYIEHYFEGHNEELSFFYRRNMNGHFKWVRLSVIKSTEYSESNQTYTYIIEDSDNILSGIAEWNASGDHLLKIRTFGNFDAYDEAGRRILFRHKQSKELFAYLIDRQGYPVTTKEIVTEVLEKDAADKTYIKYVSALAGYAIKDLTSAGYTDIIIKEWNSLRIDPDKLDCDYYHLIHGDASYIQHYHNEYMKEYSWAEETNSEILHYFDE